MNQYEFEMWSHLLDQWIDNTIEGLKSTDVNLYAGASADVNAICSLWDNEDTWTSILNKLQSEGSTWYVWWQDGVMAFEKKAKE